MTLEKAGPRFMGLYLRGQWVDVESIADFDARVPTGPKKRKEKRNAPLPIAALRVG